MGEYLKNAAFTLVAIVMLPVILIYSLWLVPWLIFAMFRGK